MGISVVLPNYNHGKWLPRSLNALVRQEPKPSEIIIVDDGSTDDSVEIIEEFQKAYQFIRLVRHKANQGAEAALKTGLSIATGDLLYFAASDDLALPGLFARATSSLRTTSEAAFFCSEVAIINENDDIVGFRPIAIPRSTPAYLSPADVRLGLKTSDNWFVGTSVIYRHNRLAEIGYFDRSLGTLQDAIATRLLAFRHGFFFAPEILAAWRTLPDSLSSRSSLSPAENDRLLDKAVEWIRLYYPEDIKENYAKLFSRRLRFNFARAKLIFGGAQPAIEPIADVLKLRTGDRVLMRFVSRFPMGSHLLLAWIVVRARPYGLVQLARALWRNLTINQVRKVKLSVIIQACKPSSLDSAQVRRIAC